MTARLTWRFLLPCPRGENGLGGIEIHLGETCKSRIANVAGKVIPRGHFSRTGSHKNSAGRSSISRALQALTTHYSTSREKGFTRHAVGS
jgi:hypothetical protein